MAPYRNDTSAGTSCGLKNRRAPLKRKHSFSHGKLNCITKHNGTFEPKGIAHSKKAQAFTLRPNSEKKDTRRPAQIPKDLSPFPLTSIFSHHIPLLRCCTFQEPNPLTLSQRSSSCGSSRLPSEAPNPRERAPPPRLTYPAQ